MPETYLLTSAQGGATGEYRQVLYWTIKGSLSRMILLQGFGLLLFVIFGIVFSALALTVGKQPPDIHIGLPEILIGLAGIALTVVLHEVVHGIVMTLCGARPQYGVLWKQGMFYATAPGYGFRRNSYLVIALAPLVVLTGGFILGMGLLQGTPWVLLMTVGALMNGSGAAGDLWIASIVLRYPPSAYIVDERDGMRVLLGGNPSS